MKWISEIKSALCALVPDKTALKRIAAFSLLFLFAAHAFCFFNLTYSGESVMLNVSKGKNAQLSGGLWLQPIYFMLRGAISSPMFVGILSALYLMLTGAVCAALFRFRSTLSLFALCGALIVNPAVLSVCAASLHTADAAFLAQLLACLGALLSMRTRWGFLPAACLFAAAPALDPTALSCGAAFSLLALTGDLLGGVRIRGALAAFAKTLLALFAGLALYLIGYRVMLLLTGNDPHAAWQMTNGSVISAYLTPVRLLFAPLTAYPALSTLLRAALLLLAALSLFSAKAPVSRCAAAAVCALLLPLLCNLPQHSASAPAQTGLAFCAPDLLLIVLLSAAPMRKNAARIAAGAFAVLILGCVVFSNQVYVKKNLEFHSTVSVMTRVLDRIEEAEGYTPGYTPVALVGSLDESILSVERKGFEHLSALDAAANNYAPVTDEDNIWYTWEVMGYPLNFISTFELSKLSALDEVKAMPAFPEEGCVQYVGDVLVAKLSP